jgi:hypothetical protein
LVKRRAIKLLALAVLGASWAIAGTASAGAAVCPNEALRAGPSAALPECRAYERVSPADKANGDVETRLTLGSRGVAGLDEHGYAFLSYNGLTGSEGGALQTGNVATRGSGGWSSFPISPPTINTQSVPALAVSLLLSRDLNKVLVESQKPLTPDAQPGPNLYVRTISPPSLQLITPVPFPVFGNTYTMASSEVLGASDDFSHIVFQNRAQLTPESPVLSPIGGGMNLYEWNGSTLTNIGVLPGETEPISDGIPIQDSTGAVSPDGQRVIFQAEGGGAYILRDHGTPMSLGSSIYAASRDLSTIFTVAGITGNGDLYRYDVETGEKVNLTAAAAGAGGPDIDRTNLLSSPNGDAVFFAAGAVMAPGATLGAPNLYRWSAGDGFEFIAKLDPSDPFVDQENITLRSMEASTSAAGDALAFTSIAALTGESPVGVREIYHWSKTEGLTCASCKPGLESPSGYPEPAAQILGGAGATLLSSPSPLSTDGKKVFFTTTDRLVPEDNNGLMDVYEWVGGAVHLISTGAGEYGAEFLDASPSTKDVFFVTRDRLVPADRDENTDVYDAREGGGFPEPALAVPCEAEACRPPLEAVPVAPQIGSRSFVGPGNPVPSIGKKPHKKKHRKHKHHKNHAHKHHKNKKQAQKRNKKTGKACKAKTKRCPRGSHHGHTAGKRG